MKKISLVVITALMLGFGMGGCGLFTSTTNDITADRVKSVSCKDLQDITLFNAKKAEYYYLQNEERRIVDMLNSEEYRAMFGINILDLNSGKMESTRYTERKDGLPEVFYCDKIEFLSTISSENKSFGINGNGANDSNANVIKEVYNTQKVKDGKVTAKNIKVTTYRLEPIKVVKYNGVIYTAGSPIYQKIKNLRDKLTCLTIKNRTYCDGDLVKLENNTTLMIKAYKTQNKTNADIFYYSDGKPSYVTANQYGDSIKDKIPNVIGNHNLKEYNMSDIYTLKLHEVKTFKEF